MMISNGEDILWVSSMLGHNKNQRKVRALFLTNGAESGQELDPVADFDFESTDKQGDVSED